MQTIEEVEERLDEYYSFRKSFISLDERREMYYIIMTHSNPPTSVMQKFAWYNVFPIDFEDGVWGTFE